MKAKVILIAGLLSLVTLFIVVPYIYSPPWSVNGLYWSQQKQSYAHFEGNWLSVRQAEGLFSISSTHRAYHHKVGYYWVRAPWGVVPSRVEDRFITVSISDGVLIESLPVKRGTYQEEDVGRYEKIHNPLQIVYYWLLLIDWD